MAARLRTTQSLAITERFLASRLVASPSSGLLQNNRNSKWKASRYPLRFLGGMGEGRVRLRQMANGKWQMANGKYPLPSDGRGTGVWTFSPVNPKGISPQSPGLERSDYPGWTIVMVTTPTGLRPPPEDATLSGLR